MAEKKTKNKVNKYTAFKTPAEIRAEARKKLPRGVTDIGPSRIKTFTAKQLTGFPGGLIIDESDPRLQGLNEKQLEAIRKRLAEEQVGERYETDRTKRTKVFKGILGPSVNEDDPRVQEEIKRRTEELKKRRLEETERRKEAAKTRKGEVNGRVPLSDVQKEQRMSPLERRLSKGGAFSRGLLTAGKIGARAVPILGTGLLAYEGARALGFDPFGVDEQMLSPVMTPAPTVATTPKEQPIRFGQVLRPTSESTAKEVLNAALLRAGLSLMRPTRPGQTPVTQALEAAATVGDTQQTFTSGEEALKAGQDALGKDAKISVYQRSDGTFGYSGTTPGISLTDNSFFGEGGLTTSQIEEYMRRAGNDPKKATELALADGYTEEQLGIK